MSIAYSNAQNIIPEWNEPKGLVLVFPKELRSSLIPFYKEFIKTVLTESSLQELTIVSRPKAEAEIENFIHSIKKETKIRILPTPEVQDIWARDFCPIYFSNQIVFKGLYNPSYFKKNEIEKYADPDDKTGIDLALFLNLNLKYFIKKGKGNLILDGGNFISNGIGTAIVTNRVIADNENLSIEKIREVFKNTLNITDLIFVPVEPGDETGHIDGIVRFADEKTVFIASYPLAYEAAENNISQEEFLMGKQFLDDLAKDLSQKFRVIRIENAIPKTDTKFPSAFGNYINYLRIGNTIFLPQYGISQDKKAEQTIRSNFPEITVVLIKKDVEKLSKFGGVLNCISWTYY